MKNIEMPWPFPEEAGEWPRHFISEQMMKRKVYPSVLENQLAAQMTGDAGGRKQHQVEQDQHRRHG